MLTFLLEREEEDEKIWDRRMEIFLNSLKEFQGGD